MLTLHQVIVAKNMCFYGCYADLHRVLFLAVATQLRMNCFGDLFVPTDMVSCFPHLIYVQCMSNPVFDSRLVI